MKALTLLRKFIVAKQGEYASTGDDLSLAEIRAYANDNAAELAQCFGVSADTFRRCVAAVDGDRALARKLLGEIKRAQELRRDTARTARMRSAQESADAIGSFAHWTDVAAVQVVVVDIVSLLASALTAPEDALYFVLGDTPEARAEDRAVIPMEPLFRIAKLERADLTAWVDAVGLHIRYPSAAGTQGGWNIRPLDKIENAPDFVYVHVPRRPGVGSHLCIKPAVNVGRLTCGTLSATNDNDAAPEIWSCAR